jgi:hypothetical protein
MMELCMPWAALLLAPIPLLFRPLLNESTHATIFSVQIYNIIRNGRGLNHSVRYSERLRPKAIRMELVSAYWPHAIARATVKNSYKCFHKHKGFL